MSATRVLEKTREGERTGGTQRKGEGRGEEGKRRDRRDENVNQNKNLQNGKFLSQPKD